VAFATYRTGTPPARFATKSAGKTLAKRDVRPLRADAIIGRRVEFVARQTFGWLGLAGADESQPRLKSPLRQTNC
jgi:hypothetical protein